MASRRLAWQGGARHDTQGRAREASGRPIEVRGLGVDYPGTPPLTAIANVSFVLEDREFLTVVGPSGCGKTTLLRAISGLLPPTRGDIVVNGVRVAGPPVGLAVVVQEYGRSLLPWLTVAKNVMLPLAAAGIPKRRRIDRMEAALHEVGLSDVAEKYPWQLSGGMQQRVAIARAVAYEPTILLMDEPFASVDAQTRADLEDLLLRVQRDTKVAVVFVTHDIDEAVYLGQRVLVLSARPTMILKTLSVDLGYPRDQIDTKASGRFIALRTEVLRLVRRAAAKDPSVVNAVVTTDDT